MGQHEEANGDQLATGDVPVPGPRRATYTPAPPGSALTVFGQDSAFNPVPFDAPPPAPSTVVIPPPWSALPQPPTRKSMPDSELLASLTDGARPGGSLEAIERLQEQLQIRELEAREYRTWENSMLAIGTPEAFDVVEEIRTTFTEVIQIIPEGVTAQEPARTPGGGAIPPDEAEDPAAMDEGAQEIPRGDAPPPPPQEPPVAPAAAMLPTAEVPPASPGVSAPENSGLETTAAVQRTGRAIRMFWLWFAANSSVLSLVFGGILLNLGMSLRQAIVAALAGVALSFLPIGLTTLASKWSGQPTMVVSRASFGVVGNVVPAALTLVTRLLWGAVLLWFLAASTARLLVGAGIAGGLGEGQLTLVAAGAGFLLALVIAFFGYRLLAVAQLVLSVLSGVLVILLIAVSWPLVDIQSALTIGDGPWVLVLTGAILVFSFVGLVWSTSAGDLARYQRPSSSGAASMLAASIGAALPPFVLIGYGAMLAASDPSLAFRFIVDPAGALAGIVPAWFLIPLIAAIAIGLLSGVILSVYSGGLAVQATGLRLRREWALLGFGIVLGAIAVSMTVLGADLAGVVRDSATTLAVPTAAWLGIFAAEVMIRNRRFHAESLLHRGGVYPNVNWVNLVMLLVASAIGFGFTTASAGWLAWQGYLFAVIGVPVSSDLARADVGVLVALAVALLTPLAAGIRSIRRQEADRDATRTDPAPR